MIVSRASPGGADRLGELALLVVERRVDEQAAHADDGVERRSDLVRHRREEAALGLVRLLRALARLLGIGEEACVLEGDGRLLREADEEAEVRRR